MTPHFFLGEETGDSDGNIVYYPSAFSRDSCKVLRHIYPDALIATEGDAVAFGLNSVSDGRHVFIAPQARDLTGQLADRGFVPVPIDLSEFRKAAWRYQVLYPGDPLMSNSVARPGIGLETPPSVRLTQA